MATVGAMLGFAVMMIAGRGAGLDRREAAPPRHFHVPCGSRREPLLVPNRKVW